MNLPQCKKLVIGGVQLKKLLINGVQAWKSGYTNRVPESIDENGNIYNGRGYKNGYRVRSGGAEGALSGGACTGFIAVKGGDVVRFSGWDFSYPQNGNAVNISNASFANIGQFTTHPAAYGIFASGYTAYSLSSVVRESDGVWKWIVPPAASGAAYIRISGYDAGGAPGARMIVTVNEEIE